MVNEKCAYARYVQAIGGYHREFSNYRMALKYFVRAKEIFDNVKGHEHVKWNLLYHLVISNIALGQLQEAEKNIQIMEQMFNAELIDKNSISYIHSVMAKLLFAQGKYTESLEKINKVIEVSIKNGLSPDDLL